LTEHWRGRWALVTGASAGIGRALAEQLAAEGANLFLTARRLDRLNEIADWLRMQRGIEVETLAADLIEPGAPNEIYKRTEASGIHPSLLVNNAGSFKLATADTADPRDFARAIDVNLVAPFRLVRAFLPDMRARKRGHLVSIGSIADHVAFPENSAYAASKFGLRGLHEVLRTELIGSGVRTTLVSPGPVDTALWDEINPDERPGFTPRASMLGPDAVAAAVMFAVTQPADVNIDEIRVSRA